MSTKFSPGPGSSSRETVFHEVLEQFKASLSSDNREEFQFATLDDLQAVIAAIQEKQASEKKMRNLTRLKKFLEAMDEYGKVIEIFLNNSQFIAYVWGPMKFLLLVANTYTQAFDALVEMYQAIGEQLPLLAQYQALFQANPYMRRVLELIYWDILEFHTKALKYFKQKVWRQLFQATWKTFRTRFSGILDNLRRHKVLIESQASLTQFEQFERARVIAEDEFRVMRDNEAKRRKIAVRDWLGAANSEADQENCAEVRVQYPGTGRWLLQVQHMQAWLDPNSSSTPLLWLTGIPGAGKTILTSLLVEEARKLSSIKVVFFYCKHHDSQRDSFLAVARSLLWQLLRHSENAQLDESLLAYFYENASTSGESLLNSVNIAKDMLDIALRKFDKVYIILDGLDECPIKEKKLVASWFRSIVDSISENEPEAMRCLFVSQDDNDCGKLFSGIPIAKISSIENSSDISAFCQSWAKSMLQKFCLSEAKGSSIATKVTKRADGMFLFARLVMANLFGQTSRARLDKELEAERFPKGLAEAYARIVDRIFVEAEEPEIDDAAKLLGWLVCARRSLKWHEIQGAISVNLEDRSINFKDRQLCVDSKDLCGSLVEIRSDGVISLVHTTARHYLISQKFVLPNKEEYNLAVMCLCYLSNDCFSISRSSEAVETHIVEGCYAFLDYAIVYWLDHLERCVVELGKTSTGSIELLGAEIREFLRKHFSGEDPGDTISKSTRERFHVFETYEFFNRLGRAAEYWKNCVQSKAQKSKEACVLDLNAVLSRIRSTIDDLASRQLSTSLPQKLRKFSGIKIFKCAKYDCEFFYEGFETIQERDRHYSRHEKTYYCTFPGCPRGILGFEDSKTLQQHVTIDHHARHMDDSKFPVYQEPKSINIELAIKTGNIAAVERWAQQFDGCIPDSSAGIFRRAGKRSGIHWKSPFSYALQRKDSEIAEFFLRNISSPGQLGFAIIYCILVCGNKSLLPWVIEIPMDGVDPDEAYPAISLVMSRGEDLVASHLLKTLGSKSPDHLVPLKKRPYVTLAGQFNCLSSLQYLIVECKINTDSVDKRHSTALMAAAELGHTDIIKLLVDGGHCDINFKNRSKETALSKAAANGHDHVIRILFPEHPVPDHVIPWLKVSQLRNAARSGNTEEIFRLLEDDRVSVNTADIDHYTPLLHAVENGHYSVVCALLDHRGDSIDVNYKCNCHHLEVRSRNSERKSTGATALILATIHGYVSIVRRLLQCKGIKTEERVSMKPYRLYTALDLSEYNKDAEITALLQEHQKPATSMSSVINEKKGTDTPSTSSAPASPGPVVNPLDDTARETFPTGRPLEDGLDYAICKHYKRNVLKTSMKTHLITCLKKKKEKAQRKQERKRTYQAMAKRGDLPSSTAAGYAPKVGNSDMT